MIYKDKAIKFAPELVPLIKNGTKTLTYRVGDKYEFLNIGDRILVADSSNNSAFAEIEIIEKSHTTFGELPLNRNGHEVYSSKDAQREKFKRFYGKEIQDDEKILVLGYKVIQMF